MALFEVTSDSLVPVWPTTFGAEGWRERADLQRLLRDHPEVIEQGLLILAEEYSNWADSGRRIDLLGLSQDGRLTVIELKLDDGAAMELQAVRYAAMVANMTFEQAVDAHAAYLARRNKSGDAREIISQHLGTDPAEDTELMSTHPRIVLVASAFHRELTTSVLWLNDSGLDIRCVRAVPYRLREQLLLDAEQVIPLPEAADYVLRLRDKARESAAPSHPEVEWSQADMERLAESLQNPTLLALLDLCAASPGEFVPFAEAIAAGGQTPPQARGATGGFTPWVRKWFARNNWPMEYQWSVRGDSQMHYRLQPALATWWREARALTRGPASADRSPAIDIVPEATAL